MGLAGVKSDCTEKEGLARRASKSSHGLVFEDDALIADTFAIRLGWRLMVWMALSQCQCLRIIAQVWLTDSENDHNSIGIVELKIHRAETLARYQARFPVLAQRTTNCSY